MGLETLFVCQRTLKRYREKPLGDVIDGFFDWLLSQNYAEVSVRKHIGCISAFNEYLQAEGLNGYEELSHEHCEIFLKQCFSRRIKKLKRKRVSQCELYSINRFLAYLRASHNKNISLKAPLPHQTLIDNYAHWLGAYLHCSPGTINLRKEYLSRFLQTFGTSPILERLASLSCDEAEELFLSYCETHGYSARRSMQATLRTFFRYSIKKGIVSLDLSKSIPTIRTYKLSTVPRGISEEDAQKVLNIMDRSTKVGKRDYAIMKLLYHYGVRSRQIQTLRLENVNWRQSKILFRALKHGKPVVDPLLNDVGGALLDYLQNARPETTHPEVFLRARAPYQPLDDHSTVSEIVARHIRKANINLTSCGAHVFRHGLAQRMLQQGSSLKPIADCLGHSSIQTTAIYAKVDFVALTRVPLELPTKEVL